MSQKVSFLTATLLVASPLAAVSQDWQSALGYEALTYGDYEARWYAEADYLLWYMNEGGLGLGQTTHITQSGSQVTGGDFVNVQNDQVLYLKNKWSSGVRAALGFKPTNTTWDIRAEYTYFTDTVRRTDGPVPYNTFIANVMVFNFVFPTYTPISLDAVTAPYGFGNTSLSTKWRLDFNQFDLEFGKEFYLAESVTFRPFFGVRGLWVTQELRITSLLNFTALMAPVQAVTGSQTEISTFNPHQRFDGGGLHGGFDLSFHLISGLDFYGNFGAGILWGRAKAELPSSLTTLSSDAMNSKFYDTMNRSHQMSVLNFDFGIGLIWNQWIDFNRHLLSVKLGWEQHFYSNINQLQSFYVASVGTTLNSQLLDHNVYRGDLTLSGFIFGLSLLY